LRDRLILGKVPAVIEGVAALPVEPDGWIPGGAPAFE
jgi:hypothetical protein